MSGTISITNTADQGSDANNKNKTEVSKNCAPFTNCMSEINNTQMDHDKDIDVVISMYNLIEYSNNY